MPVAALSDGLIDDVRVRSFIFSTGHTDHFKPVSLVDNVTDIKDDSLVEHREQVVVRFSYTICFSSIVFPLFGSSRSGD